MNVQVRNKPQRRLEAADSDKYGNELSAKEHQKYLSDGQREYEQNMKLWKQCARQGRKSLTMRRQSGRNFSSPGSDNYLYHRSEHVPPSNESPVNSNITPSRINNNNNNNNNNINNNTNFVSKFHFGGRSSRRSSRSSKSSKSSKTIRRNRQNRRI